MKLCIIYNFAQKYREGIFNLLEQQYDCHWVFGNNNSDIKPLDYTLFRSVQEVKNRKLFGPVYYQNGVIPLLKKYDTILILGELYCLSTWLILLLRCTFLRNKRIYLWSHGWYGREGVIKRFLKRCFFAMADKCFLYGHYAKDVARSQGYKKDNICIIYNSLDYDKQIQLRKEIKHSDIYTQHFNNNNSVILFIGRLTKVKKLDVLISAMSLLNGMYNLVIIGDGEMRKELERLATQLNISANIWFYGACYDEHENVNLLYNADLCVSPGNVGLTAVHAMTYGVPVITHNKFEYQMPEFETIKEGVTGAFFKKDNVESLAKCISTWFSEHKHKREIDRINCYNEISLYWNPHNQIEIFKNIIR